MRISPLDIQNKQFRAARMRGYNADDVDAFLDEVAVGVEEAQREVESLRAKLSAEPAADAGHDEMKETLSQAIIQAQRLSDQIQADAKSEAERIRSEAAAEAERLRMDAKTDADVMMREARAEAERMRIDASAKQAELLSSVERLGAAESEFRVRFEDMLEDFKGLLAGKPVLDTHAVASAERASTASLVEHAPAPAPQYPETSGEEGTETPAEGDSAQTMMFDVPTYAQEGTAEGDTAESGYGQAAEAEGFSLENQEAPYPEAPEQPQQFAPEGEQELSTSPMWQADQTPSEQSYGAQEPAAEAVPPAAPEATGYEQHAPEETYGTYAQAQQPFTLETPVQESSAPEAPEAPAEALYQEQPDAPAMTSDDLSSKDEIAEAVERMRRMLGEAGVAESGHESENGSSDAEHAAPAQEEDLFGTSTSESGFGDLGPGVPGAHRKRDLRGNPESEVD